jgi:hypothetical protein
MKLFSILIPKAENEDILVRIDFMNEKNVACITCQDEKSYEKGQHEMTSYVTNNRRCH